MRDGAMFSRKLTRAQFARAMGLHIGVPYLLYAAAFVAIGATKAIGAGYIWFFIGLPLLALWTYAFLIFDLSARARDAGVPVVLAPILATLLLAGVLPTLQFHWQWLMAANAACLAFIAMLPSAEAGREPQFGWLGFVALTCFMELAALALLAIVKYGALVRGDMELFALLNRPFSAALTFMPIAVVLLIGLLPALWLRERPAMMEGAAQR